MRLKRDFYNRSTLIVAKELLGKYLVRRIDGRLVRARIIETEAYRGLEDKASHASKGITPRTKVMFGPAGFTYVYMIYGMHHCLDIVTENEGYPAAVLVRTVETLNPKSEILNKLKIKNPNTKNLEFRDSNLVLTLNGPGKLCRELKIDRTLNNIDITKSKEIWIKDTGEKIKPFQIKIGKRIGIAYAGSLKDKLWRFWIKT